MVEEERKRIAHQLLGEVRRLGRELAASRARLKAAVETAHMSVIHIHGADPFVGPFDSAVLTEAVVANLTRRSDEIEPQP